VKNTVASGFSRNRSGQASDELNGKHRADEARERKKPLNDIFVAAETQLAAHSREHEASSPLPPFAKDAKDGAPENAKSERQKQVPRRPD